MQSHCFFSRLIQGAVVSEMQCSRNSNINYGDGVWHRWLCRGRHIFFEEWQYVHFEHTFCLNSRCFALFLTGFDQFCADYILRQRGITTVMTSWRSRSDPDQIKWVSPQWCSSRKGARQQVKRESSEGSGPGVKIWLSWWIDNILSDP